MNYYLGKFKRFCGFVTGFVFFLSGIVKLLDPVGAGLVMDEYFDFMHVGFLGFAAKPVGVAFALAEVVIGTSLITGVWRGLTAAAAMVFQGFFTLLTLALVIFNPEMDCGCFGEAIHLTHMQTFLKNLILCALLAIAFIPFRGFGRPKKRKYVSFGIVMTAVLAFTVYSWMYIPLVDFTDYRPSAMLAAADASSSEDMYEAYFIYEKEGVEEKFTIENLPDSTWTFVSTETMLKEDAYVPVSLSFTDAGGGYMDELAARGKVMVVSIPDPDIKPRRWEGIATFVKEAEEAGFAPLVLMAANPSEAPAGIPESISDKIYYSDYKTLITLNRSNGGATYFSDGSLICKWAYKALPNQGRLEEIAAVNGLEQSIEKDTRGSLAFQGFLLYVFAVMLLL